jgi:hypothetical protein
MAKKQQHLSLGTQIPKVATISHPRDLLHELLHSNAAVQLQPLLSTVEWNLDDAVLLTRRTHSILGKVALPCFSSSASFKLAASHPTPDLGLNDFVWLGEHPRRGGGALPREEALRLVEEGVRQLEAELGTR